MDGSAAVANHDFIFRASLIKSFAISVLAGSCQLIYWVSLLTVNWLPSSLINQPRRRDTASSNWKSIATAHCAVQSVYIYLLYSLYGLPSNFRPGFKLGHCRGNIGSILLKVLFRENNEVNRQSWLTHYKQWMHKTCMAKLTLQCLFVWPPI